MRKIKKIQLLGSGLDHLGIDVGLPAEAQSFLFSPSRPALGLTQSPSQCETRPLSPGVKRSGREDDPTSYEVNKAWNYTSTPTFVFIGWCFIKYRDNFTINLQIGLLLLLNFQGFIPSFMKIQPMLTGKSLLCLIVTPWRRKWECAFLTPVLNGLELPDLPATQCSWRQLNNSSGWSTDGGGEEENSSHFWELNQGRSACNRSLYWLSYPTSTDSEV
jgi:hypothetical protein